jgi:ribosomal protein S8
LKATFDQLEKYIGSYSGQGINHEHQPFTGELVLKKGINSISIHYKAIGKDGQLYHEEHTVIALDINKNLGLWSVNTNNPVMLHHTCVKNEVASGATEIIFGFGKKEMKQSF